MNKEISSLGLIAAVKDQDGFTYDVVFSTSPGGLNAPSARKGSTSPTKLKGKLPSSIGDHHLVSDLCDFARTVKGREVLDALLA
jgi:hypothetical protein